MSDDLVERLADWHRAVVVPQLADAIAEAAARVTALQADLTAARAELAEIKGRDGEEELQRIWEMLKRYGIDDHSVFVAAKRGAQAFAELAALKDVGDEALAKTARDAMIAFYREKYPQMASEFPILEASWMGYAIAAIAPALIARERERAAKVCGDKARHAWAGSAPLPGRSYYLECEAAIRAGAAP